MKLITYSKIGSKFRSSLAHFILTKIPIYTSRFDRVVSLPKYSSNLQFEIPNNQLIKCQISSKYCYNTGFQMHLMDELHGILTIGNVLFTSKIFSYRPVMSISMNMNRVMSGENLRKLRSEDRQYEDIDLYVEARYIYHSEKLHTFDAQFYDQNTRKLIAHGQHLKFRT